MIHYHQKVDGGCVSEKEREENINEKTKRNCPITTGMQSWYIIKSIRTLNPILSERPFYDSFPPIFTLQKCSI